MYAALEDAHGETKSENIYKLTSGYNNNFVSFASMTSC